MGTKVNHKTPSVYRQGGCLEDITSIKVKEFMKRWVNYSSFDSIWKLFFIPEPTQGLSSKESPKQDYSTVFRSERQKSSTMQREPSLVPMRN